MKHERDGRRSRSFCPPLPRLHPSSFSLHPSALPRWYRRLLAAYGPQGWWPGRTPFEVAVGAILTQNTAWTNVEKAIANLRRAGALSFRGMKRLPERKLAALIRPSGYFNQKAKKLRAFLAWLETRGGKAGSVRHALAGPLGEVRESLLAVHGIGPETADSILLYAAGKPSFVIDAYTRRIAARLGLAKEGATYDDLKRLYEAALPADAALFNEFHALLVQHGKVACRKTPRCRRLDSASDSCCLADMCAFASRRGEPAPAAP